MFIIEPLYSRTILQSYDSHMTWIIAVLENIVNNCLYMNYKPTSNFELLVQGPETRTFLIISNMSKCLHLSKTRYNNI